jgi:hypothetical protein
MESLQITAAEGQPHLEVRCGGGACLGCKELDLKMTGMKPMTLTAAGGQVCLTGPAVRARANLLTTDQKELLILEGQVRLHYTKDGQSAEVLADRIEVNLGDDTLKIKP